jgi:hypothetical protein
MQGFLFALPIFGADYDKVIAGSSSDPERFVVSQALLYELFKIISEFVNTDCVHAGHHIMYGNTVRFYVGIHDKYKCPEIF